MFRTISSFMENESGATAIEYGLIAALVSVAAIGALQSMGESLGTMYGGISGDIDTAVASGSGAGS